MHLLDFLQEKPPWKDTLNRDLLAIEILLRKSVRLQIFQQTSSAASMCFDIEFSDQAMQLQRWGLTHILPFFVCKATNLWSFFAREITSSCSTLLKERVEIVSEAMT